MPTKRQADPAAAKARQLAGLKRGRVSPGSAMLSPGKPRIPEGEPELTPALAYEFVKLLHAGLPQLQAMAYLAPAYDRGISKIIREGWRRRWMNDPQLLDAAAQFNGGAWVELAPDKRIEVALDKHYAELAYFLYTHDYAHLDESDLRKADIAREALTAHLTKASEEGASDAPWVKAMREIVEGTLHATQPPQLPAVPAEPVSVKVKES